MASVHTVPPASTIPMSHCAKVTVALGIITAVGAFFLLLATYQVLPPGVNAISQLGIWGQVAGFGAVAASLVLIAVGGLKSCGKPVVRNAKREQRELQCAKEWVHLQKNNIRGLAASVDLSTDEKILKAYRTALSEYKHFLAQGIQDGPWITSLQEALPNDSKPGLATLSFRICFGNRTNEQRAAADSLDKEEVIVELFQAGIRHLRDLKRELGKAQKQALQKIGEHFADVDEIPPVAKIICALQHDTLPTWRAQVAATTFRNMFTQYAYHWPPGRIT